MIKGLRRLKVGSGSSSSGSNAAGGTATTQRRISGPTDQKDKSQIATLTPKQIIRALYDYQPQGDDEMGFVQQDFLYVVDDSDPEWYVACDPLRNTSGLVPANYFEVIQRQDNIPSVSLSTALHSQISGADTVVGSDPISPPVDSSLGTTVHSRSISGVSRKTATSTTSAGSGRRKASTTLAIYGFVLYDFTAERNDELEATAGESIIIIAQSNEEWFVAKPIGRLGGPGLIPVAYVEIREVGTDRPVGHLEDVLKQAGVPQVEEWKRRAAEYKASSIPLGRFDAAQQGHGVAHSRQLAPATSTTSSGQTGLGLHQQQTQSQSQSQMFDYGYQGQSTGTTPLQTPGGRQASGSGADTGSGYFSSQPYNNDLGHGSGNTYQAGTGAGAGSDDVYVTKASVDRFAINGGRYWYLLMVQLSNGKYRNLCRYYQDFYDFQIRLLDEFPVEAGRSGGTRTLPFMPGPLALVNHSISSQRRANLDEYVHNLIRMPPHISRSGLMKQLFEVRKGDIQSDTPTSTMPSPPDEMLEHSFGSANSQSSNQYFSNPTAGPQKSFVQEKTVLPPNHTEGIQPRNTPQQESGPFEPTQPVNEAHHDQSESQSQGHIPSLSQSYESQGQQDHSYLAQARTPGTGYASTSASSAPTTQASPQSAAVSAAAAAMGVNSRSPPRMNVKVNGAGGAAAGLQPPDAGRYGHETNGSVTSLDTMTGDSQRGRNGALQHLKVKVFKGNDVVAIRIPANLHFVDLYNKIADRVGGTPRLYLNKDFSGPIVDTDEAFRGAVSGEGKIMLYAPSN